MKSYSQYLESFFPGVKVQKISINAGFSCPNRDGTIGKGGCSYCRNDSFSPSYCDPSLSIAQQLEEGKNFFARKYPSMKYLAYFQSYTNTYSPDLNKLSQIYLTALNEEGIVGLVIGTRPDTLPDDTLELLSELNKLKPVFLEIGAETSFDETLVKINRHHSWNDVVDATERAMKRNLHCGLHLIAGLPGESCEMILTTVKKTVNLPIETLKLHQLQILHGTPLFEEWKSGTSEIKPFTLHDYLNLCREIVSIVPENIVIERFLAQSPPELVAAPKWGLKNYQFMNLLNNLLK